MIRPKGIKQVNGEQQSGQRDPRNARGSGVLSLRKDSYENYECDSQVEKTNCCKYCNGLGSRWCVRRQLSSNEN